MSGLIMADSQIDIGLLAGHSRNCICRKDKGPEMIAKEDFSRIIGELNSEYSGNRGNDRGDVIVAISGHDKYTLSEEGKKIIVCYDCLSSMYPYIEKDDMKKFLSELICIALNRKTTYSTNQ